jgi:RNA polymerase sigma factor (sigma-70 family)
LRLALRSLPAEQTEIIMLSFFSDKPHSQIAAELNIPLGTVKSRLRLAMVRLRASLGAGEEP